jgi:hypothetical protein
MVESDSFFRQCHSEEISAAFSLGHSLTGRRPIHAALAFSRRPGVGGVTR